MVKVRVSFTKLADMRWLSHRELVRALMRAARRAGLPVKYSEGFSPHPKVAFSPALAVGVGGRNELMDLALTELVEAPAVLSRLNQTFPPGIKANGARVLDSNDKSLGKILNCADYACKFDDVDAAMVSASWGRAERALSMPAGEDGSVKAIQPLLLKLVETNGGCEVLLRLPIEAKMSWVISELTAGHDSEELRHKCERVNLWHFDGVRLRDPIAAVANKIKN